MNNSQEKNIHTVNIGDKIKKLRIISGLNQAGFAEKLGLTQGFISKVENNAAQFTLEHIILVAHIFSADLNSLLTGEQAGTVAEQKEMYQPKTVVQKKIDQLLDTMDEEAQRDVLKYAEEKKQLADFKRKAG